MSEAANQREIIGEVITFYSYKGGTGRTMALANVGCLLGQQLAKSGQGGKVLLVDWDLEAPGLHRFFEDKFKRTFPSSQTAQLDSHPGLLEIFEELNSSVHGSAGARGQAEDEAAEIVRQIDLHRFVLETDVPGIHLLKAGGSEDYARRVNTFRWENLFNRSPYVFAAFATRLTELYRHVLIDSRTGETDTSGICTAILPQKLVAVFTPNRQSLLGLERLIRTAAEYRAESDDLRPLVVFPLPSRIDASDESLRKDWRFGNSDKGIKGYQPLFQELFQQVYHVERCELTAYFDEVQIPHVTSCAYGESIAVLDEFRDSFSLHRCYQQFTQRLESLSVPWADTKPQQELSRPNFDFDLYISYNSVDHQAVRELADRLKQAKVKVWFDQYELKPGQAWEDELQVAINRSKACAAAVGPHGIGPWQQRELMELISRRRESDDQFRVIPILLPGADNSNLPEFLRQFVWVDFRHSLAEPTTFQRLLAAIPDFAVAPLRPPIDEPSAAKATVKDVTEGRYAACILSSRFDQEVAKTLRSGLERFARPWYALRKMRVVVNQSSQSFDSADSPSAAMERRSREANYLVLLASPGAAESPGVARDVRTWLAHRGADRLIFVLLEGTIVWDRFGADFDWQQTTALPRDLAGVFNDEPLYVDLRWARDEQVLDLSNPKFADAIARLQAVIRGISVDQARGEQIRHYKRQRYASIALTSLAMAFAVLAFGFWSASSKSQLELGQLLNKAHSSLLAIQLVAESNLVARERAQGMLVETAQYYGDALANAKKLAEGDPKNTARQRDLSLAYIDLGDVEKARGKLDLAARNYTDALAIAKRLAEGDPQNTEWPQNLSVAYEKLGDVAVAQGKLDDAAQNWSEALTISKKLATAAPSNTQWQRELLVSYMGLGDVGNAQGKLDEAARNWGDALTISKKLVEGDPSNTTWQRDLSVSYLRLGDLGKAQGKLQDASLNYGEALAIATKLAAGEPKNTELQRDLSFSYVKLADLAQRQGNQAQARSYWKQAFDALSSILSAQKTANPR